MCKPFHLGIPQSSLILIVLLILKQFCFVIPNSGCELSAQQWLIPLAYLSCSVCHMFSYSSTSFSDNATCIKCSLFAALEARLSDLEATIHTFIFYKCMPFRNSLT